MDTIVRNAGADELLLRRIETRNEGGHRGIQCGVPDVVVDDGVTGRCQGGTITAEQVDGGQADLGDITALHPVIATGADHNAPAHDALDVAADKLHRLAPCDAHPFTHLKSEGDIADHNVAGTREREQGLGVVGDDEAVDLGGGGRPDVKLAAFEIHGPFAGLVDLIKQVECKPVFLTVAAAVGAHEF